MPDLFNIYNHGQLTQQVSQQTEFSLPEDEQEKVKTERQTTAETFSVCSHERCAPPRHTYDTVSCWSRSTPTHASHADDYNNNYIGYLHQQKEVMLLPLSVCLSVSLSVCKITQKSHECIFTRFFLRAGAWPEE